MKLAKSFSLLSFSAGRHCATCGTVAHKPSLRTLVCCLGDKLVNGASFRYASATVGGLNGVSEWIVALKLRSLVYFKARATFERRAAFH